MSGRQHTLGAAFERSGVGLHTGATVAVRVEPAPDDHWIQVVRGDLPRATPVRWAAAHVRSTFLATTVGGPGWQVSTLEHLVAALAGSGVDNARIVVDGPEAPALDGSAAGWVAAVADVGLRAGARDRSPIRITERIEIRDGARHAILTPGEALHLDVTVAFDHPAIGRQRLQLSPAPDRFAAELAWARTFGFASDVERLRAAGLARGGTLENAVVFGEEGAINPGGLRAPDEVVRHKALDLVGDLALLGRPLVGHLAVVRPGHGLTRALVSAVLDAAAPV